MYCIVSIPSSSPSICTAANTAALTECRVLIEAVAAAVIVCAACELHTAAAAAATV
jgi:hypothetical protein